MGFLVVIVAVEFATKWTLALPIKDEEWKNKWKACV